MTQTLTPGQVTLSQLQTIYWDNEAAVLDRSADAAINKGAARIAEIR